MRKPAAASAAADSNGLYQKTKTETRSLPCRLTDEEKLHYGQSAAKLHNDINEKEMAVLVYALSAKGEIEEMESEESRQLRCIATGTEWRDVEVDVIYDYATGYVRYIRTDTGEEVDLRPMTQKEQQRRFDFEGDAATEQGANNRFQDIITGDGDEPDATHPVPVPADEVAA